MPGDPLDVPLVGLPAGLIVITSEENPLAVPPPKMNEWLPIVTPAASCNAIGRLPAGRDLPEGTATSDSVVRDVPLGPMPPAIRICPAPSPAGAGNPSARWIGWGVVQGS